MRQGVHRATGVDLTRIDGIDGHPALKLVSEIGADMSPFKTVKHFTSWLGLCPGNKRGTRQPAYAGCRVRQQAAERTDQAMR